MTPPIDRPAETEAGGNSCATQHAIPVSPTDETLAPDAMPAASRALTGLTGPAKIGRYVFLERLGEGGMGTVLAAYDPKLDRRVAIKLIHALRRDDTERRLRMEREAQAMAKLSHPNVVTVYEVGEYEGQLFLAMEFIKGQDLRAWLDESENSSNWRAVLDVFIQAGQGLAAAHRAGLVHRDFKPENVFVGEDGRARVGDFGLARQGVDADAETVATRAQAQVEADATALAHELTRTGAMMGTPAYMAPEQFEGKPTDARTDQFSYCTALWEALYGQRPFGGTTFPEMIVNVTGGKRVPPLGGRNVPGWVRKVLDRGLSLTPDDRYPTTEAMLAALQADPTRRRRVLAGVGLVGIAVGGWFGVHHYFEVRQVAACNAEGASIAGIWNADIQGKLRAGLLATGVAYAETTAEKVMPYFDAQAEAWKVARTEGCLDARVRRKWDEDTLDRSVWCLDERRMELEDLVAEFTRADATSIQNAVLAAAGLSKVGPCRDAHRLETLPPLPQNRERVGAVLGTLSRAGALRAAGEFKGGLDVAQQALAAAKEVGWPPLTAAARWRNGDLLERSGRYAEAEEALEGAYFQAATVGALEVAADASAGLISTVGYWQARHDEGLMWSRHADVMLANLGVGEESLRRAEALTNLAGIHESIGAYDQAKALHERALAIVEQTLGPDHPTVAAAITNVATIYEFTGAYDQAKALHERALAIKEEALGPDHPQVADSLNNLGTVYESMGAYEQAIAVLDRSLASREKALGPDHPAVATSLTNLATVYESMGADSKAKSLFERALTIRERALGPNHPDVALALSNLASIQGSQGSYDNSKALHERALAILEKVLGPDHPQVATALNNLAVVHRSSGAYEKALPLFERALAIYEKALGPDHPDLAVSLNNLASVKNSAGLHEQAKTLLIRALAINETALGPGHPAVASSLNLLAGVHFSTGAFGEAKALYEQALAIDERALRPDHMNVAYYLIGLARVALAERRPEDAVAYAERAVRVREAGNAPEEKVAESHFVLARALWETSVGQGGDRDRALLLAHQARDTFAELKGRGPGLAEVEAFLAKHGGAP